MTGSEMRLQAYLKVWNDTTHRPVIDHLRARQTEVWTKAGSVLAFDGLLITSLLVLASGQRDEMLPNDVLEKISFLLGLGFLLFSGLLALLAINQAGQYPKDNSAEALVLVFCNVLDAQYRWYKFSAWLTWWGSILCIYVLFSCLITSGIFDVRPDFLRLFAAV